MSKSRLSRLSLSVQTNFLTQGLTMILAVAALPVYIQGLGEAGYGIYSFLLILIGYLSFLDLGLNAGAVRFVAEAVAAGDREKVRKVIGTISRVYLFTAGAGSLTLFLGSGFIARHFLNEIPEDLIPEAIWFFRLGAVAFFLNLYSIFLGGLQTAVQKQYLSNSIRFTGDSLRLLSGMVLILSGYGLVPVILSNIFINLAVVILLLKSAKKELGRFSLFRPFDRTVLTEIFSYSGVVLAGTLVALAGTQANQILIGYLLPVAMIAFYSGAYDTTTKLYFIPKNLSTPLFPLWLEMKTRGEIGKIELLLFRALKFIGLAVILLLVPLALGTRSLLTVWIGSSFSDGASLTFLLLLPGILVSSLGYIFIPLAYVFDLQKKALVFQSVQAVLNVVLCLLLIPVYGVAGAAAAFSLTQILTVPVMGWVLIRQSVSLRQLPVFLTDFLKISLAGLVSAGVFILMGNFSLSGWTEVIFRFSTALAVSGVFSYFFVLDATDRQFISRYTPLRLPGGSKPAGENPE